MTRDNEELKPCPFCGGDPMLNEYEDESLYSHNEVSWYYVDCGCEAKTMDSENKQEAIDAWNRRNAGVS